MKPSRHPAGLQHRRAAGCSRRRSLALLVAGSGLVGACGSLLTACGSSPPVRLYRLPSAPPQPVPARAAPVAEAWQLLMPVRIPDYLDRQALLLPQGEAGLLALSDHRWAESLRDAVPRVLREDLTALRGQGRIWASPLPAGAAIAGRLRVELLALEAAADRRSVHLQARWTLVDPQGRSAPRSGSADLAVPSTGPGIDELVAAHRLALWRLAEQIAGMN